MLEDIEALFGIKSYHVKFQIKWRKQNIYKKTSIRILYQKKNVVQKKMYLNKISAFLSGLFRVLMALGFLSLNLSFVNVF